MPRNKNVDEQAIVKEYLSYVGLEKVALHNGVGKKRAREILLKNGVKLRDIHSERMEHNYVVPDWRIEKYPPKEGYHYIAVAKDGKYTTNDYQNGGGFLTSYIKKTYGIEKPTLYDRREYYKKTGNYWWEQWFDIKLVEDVDTKKCPYCDWETVDVENKSGAFEVHLRECHNMTKEEHLKAHPEDIDYFSKYKERLNHLKKLQKKENFVYCPICGERFEKITYSHLKLHNISIEEFREKYPEAKVMSDAMMKQTIEAVKMGNLVVSKKRFISKYERELRDFLKENGVDFEANRQILIGREIDILIPSRKIGIEFDGLKWHTEWFGKKRHNYHLDKTIECNKQGYGLIHIFEDEYVNSRDIVYHKLSHILHLDENLPRIMARKCIVKEIYKNDAETFLEKYHIQGFSRATVYLGCYYGDILIGVMTFKHGNIKNDCWELTRFATDYHYNCVGVGGKMFKFFVRNFNPDKVISFADRRWTVDPYNNLYTNMGFALEKFGAPDYRYYKDASKNDLKHQRIHKMLFNKKKLSKKYGFPLTMTETEMAKELGYDRIWDCGLIKYVWINNKENEK